MQQYQNSFAMNFYLRKFTKSSTGNNKYRKASPTTSGR